VKFFKALLPVALLAAFLATASVAASPKHAAISIRHQTMHCHAWSLGNGAWTAHVNAKLAAGGSITFTDNDVMSHKLIQQRGPHAVFTGSHTMSHMGATVRVTFPRAGTYTFTTKAGEDYKNLKVPETVGEDNVLSLTVVVS
jgi:plastocyanin